MREEKVNKRRTLVNKRRNFEDIDEGFMQPGKREDVTLLSEWLMHASQKNGVEDADGHFSNVETAFVLHCIAFLEIVRQVQFTLTNHFQRYHRAKPCPLSTCTKPTSHLSPSSVLQFPSGYESRIEEVISLHITALKLVFNCEICVAVLT